MYKLCMPKLSGQLEERGIPKTLTRTQRRIEQAETKEEVARRKAELEEAQQKLSQAQSLEEYEKIYASLSDFQKRYSASPQEVRSNIEQQRQETVTKVEDRLTQLQQQKADLDAKRQKDADDFREKRKEIRARYKGEERSKRLDDLEEDERRRNDYLDEQAEYLRGVEEGLNEGLGKLNAGQFLNYSSVYDYSDKKGDFYQRKEEYRNRQKKESREAYNRLLTEDPYAPIFEEFQKKYQGRIDWTDPKVVAQIKELGFAERSPERFLKEKTTGLKEEKKVTPSYDIAYYTTPTGERKVKITREKATGKLTYQELEKGGLRLGFQAPSEKELQEAEKKAQEQAIAEKKTELAGKPIFIPYEYREGQFYERIPKEPTEKKSFYTKETDLYLTYKGTQLYDEEGKPITFEDKISTESKYPIYFDIERYAKVSKGGTISPLTAIRGGVISFKEGEGKIGLAEALEIQSLKGYEGTRIGSEKVEKDLLEKYDITKKAEESVKPLQEQYQIEFEKQYYAPVVRGELTFDEAVAKFEETRESKLLKEDIEKKYGETVRIGRGSIPFSERFVTGAKLTGYSLKGLGYKAIPTTPRKLATEVVITYAGYKTIKGASTLYKAVLSSTARTGISAGVNSVFIAEGSYRALKPLAQPEEVFGGVVTAGIGFAGLSATTYRYLRQPVAVPKKIPAPKPTAIKEGTVVTKPLIKFKAELGGIEREVTLYKLGSQRQLLATGRATVVTTKGRVLLEKLTRIKIKPIYSGVPTQQLGRLVEVESLQYGFTYRTPSAYQKAFDRLVKYGSTPAQAKAVLRYYAPIKRITTVTGKAKFLEGGIRPVLIEDVTRRILQPVEEVVTKTGVYKTRGAVPKIEYIKGQAVAVGETKGGATIYKGTVDIERALLTKAGKPYTPLKYRGKTLSKYEQTILAKQVGKGELTVSQVTGEVDIAKIYPYEDIATISAYKRVVPKGLKGIGTERIKAIIGKPVEVTFSEKEYLRQVYGLTYYEKAPTTAPKIIKTFKPVSQYTKADAKRLTETLKRIYGTPVKVKPLRTTTKIIQDTSGRTKIITQYQAVKLKALNLPETAPIRKIKSILRELGVVKETQTVAQASALGSSISSAIRPRLTQAEKQRERLLQSPSLAQLERQIERVAQAPAQRQASLQAQRQLQLQVQSPSLAVPSIAFQEPVIKTPVIKPDIPFTFWFDLPMKKLRSSLKKKKLKTMYGFAYQPDFTVRAIGLEPEVLTEKQAQKLVKKILTGAEIRRGVIIK